jgi:N-methylhydantoinase A
MDGAHGEVASKLVSKDREVFLPTERERATIPVIDGSTFGVGATVDGPAILDEHDTTVYVPPGTAATRDEYYNYVLTR